MSKHFRPYQPLNPGSHFAQLNCGIFTINTTLQVNNAHFANITATLNTNGTALFTWGGSGIYHASGNTPYSLSVFPYQGISQNITFENCVNGINLNHSDAKIWDIGFQNVRKGVIGRNLSLCEVYIANNAINAILVGVELILIDDADNVTINNNRINLFSPQQSAAGILLSGANWPVTGSSTLNSNVWVTQNRLEVRNGRAGILTQNLENPVIKENRIIRNVFILVINTPWFSINYTPNPQWASIRSEGNYGGDISCNEIEVGNLWHNSGADILLSNSQQTKLSCNKVNGQANRGIDILGPCDNSVIENNEMGDHTIGLKLGNSAVIGQQPLFPSYTPGNLWNGTYTNTWGNAGAVNLNISSQVAITSNQILANGNMGNYPLYPVNFPDNNPPFPGVSWFLSDQAIPSVCNPGCGPVPLVEPTGTTTMSLMEAIALGLVTASEYNLETRWILNKNLLAELMLHDSLVFLNDTLLQFFSDPTFTNLKSLNSIEDTLKNLSTLKEIYKGQIEDQDSLMNNISNMMSQNLILSQDSLQQDSALIQYNILRQAYLQESYVKQELCNEIMLERQELAYAGFTANQNFSPENYNEALVKVVNDVYYRTLAQGIDTLSAQDIALLETVIYLCPQAGGNSVYRARALYMLVNDTLEYQDSIVCCQSNYFRTAQQQWETGEEFGKVKEMPSTLLLFPNPTSTSLNLVWSQETAGELIITDALGKIIWDEQFNHATRERRIDLSTLSPGLYYLQFRSAVLNVTRKFIKQ